MTQAVLGALVVELSANLARFEQDMNQAWRTTQQSMGKIEGAIKGVGNAFTFITRGGGLAAAAAGVAIFAKNAVDAVAALDDLSEQTSLSVEFLDQLQQVAVRGGQSMDTIAAAAGKFSENVAKARGGDERLLQLFKNLGISAEELRQKDISGLFQKAASAISTASDSATGNAYATALMGKAARELAPTLADIRDGGLKAARTTAALAAEADKAQKSMNELKLRVDGISIAFGGEIAVRVNALADAFARASKEGVGLAEAFAGIYRAAVYGGDLAAAKKQFGDVGSEIVKLRGEIDKLDRQEARGGGNAFARADLERRLSDAESRRDRLVQDINRLDKKQPEAAKAELPALPDEGVGARTKASAEKAARERAEIESRIERSLAERRAAIEEQYIEEGQQRNRQRLADAKELADLEVRERESYYARVAALEEQYVEQGQAANRARLDQVREESERTNQLVRDLGLTFTSAFEDAIAGGKGFREILKGIEQDLIKLATRELVTKKLFETFTDLIGSVSGSGGGLFDFIGGLFASAKGNVFSGGQPVHAFAAGGVVSRPTLFPFASGVGLMGEAGPEAIMPLKRGADGRLGVEAQGGRGVTVNISMSGSADRRSAMQVAAEVGRAVARASRRNG